MTIIHFLVYITVIVFVAAVIGRAVRIVKMPIHLRWDLYPIPHEKGRAKYGGSILEEIDWWTKPRPKDHLGELRVMVAEIILLKGVWEHNRKLWFGSFPLHFGLYLLIGNIFLLFLNTLLHVLNSGQTILLSIIPIIAWAGCILGVIGSVIMLLMRMFDPNLSKFNTASHYFNLLMMGAIYVTGLIWLAADANFVTNLTGLYSGVLTASAIPALPVVGYWHTGFSLFFMFYLPFTHMSHFFTKYFTYHSVRWEDETNLPGDPLQKKLDPQLAQVVTWAAPYVGADGKKNWVDIVTSPVPKPEEGRK